MILNLVLLHCELQLTDTLTYLNLEDNILSLLFIESVFHFYDVIILLKANRIYKLQSLLQILGRIIHDLGSKEISDLKFSFDSLLFPFAYDFINF